MARRFVVNTGTAFALSNSAKTVLALIAGSAEPIQELVEIGISTDNTTIILLELMISTGATAGTPGTSGAASVLAQIGGFTAAGSTAPSGITHGGNYTAEPTVLSRLKAWRFTGPGPFVLQSPLGRGAQSLLSTSSAYEALLLRATAASGAPNADAYMEFEC